MLIQTVSYDVACQYSRPLADRNDFLIPKMHLMAHQAVSLSLSVLVQISRTHRLPQQDVRSPGKAADQEVDQKVDQEVDQEGYGADMEEGGEVD